ncbi:orexigenic neuropeptide QRFP [Colius striatus]|uniref:orexigenic neuropeptide QRFP n=1 Tax=Colius striatus TaxID=57412 RepID=UPI002B1E2A80|nr:orexigenic neuropeptide QRFP [Colius striatus]
MRAPYSLSCLFLLSLGTCFPRSERQEPADPGAGTRLKAGWQAVAGWGAGWKGAKRRRSEALGTLLGMAREPRGYGSDGAGERPGWRRRPELLPAAGDKRSGALGSLAEELNGYSRRKGGFTFRFGR